MTALGFVVVEFNQASGLAERTADDTIHWDRSVAAGAAEAHAEEAASIGRRETYRVAEVTLLGEEMAP